MKRKPAIDYRDPEARREVLIRQRRGMWTPEQVASLAGHFRLRPGMKLLDAACGYGYVMRTWGPYCLPGGRLVGLDLDRNLIAGARRRLRPPALKQAASFVTGDICAMPLPDDEFDAVIASVVFCHLAEPERALDEMVRVAKPGGCVVVLDNARTGGAGAGWQSWCDPTVEERVAACEMFERTCRGRKQLGQGDYSVGCYVPGWLEARGLEDVGARTNERVIWIAPPYRSPEQRTALRNARERLRAGGRARFDRHTREQALAGGCTEEQLREQARGDRLARRRFGRALAAGTAAFAWSTGSFWAIWGFKPRP